jgi:Putative zinc-finger
VSNVDLHPEDLLDKEILGELSDEERARLEAHVAVCKSCQFERMAREDFRAELDVETELAEGEALKIVNVERVQLPAAEPPVRRAPFRGRVALLVAAALLLVTAVAGAGWVSIRTITGKRQPERTPTLVETVSEAPPRRPVAVGNRPAPVESAPSPEPDVPIAEPDVPIAQPDVPIAQPDVPIAQPDVPIAQPDVPRGDAVPIAEPDVPRGDAVPIAEPDVPRGSVHPSNARSISGGSPPVPGGLDLRDSRPPTARTSAPSNDALPVAPTRTASTVFAEANAARVSGDYSTAFRLYSEVQSSFPSSAEARTTQAILGRLLLDRGNAAGALRQYDAYLSGGGGLREEAMVGRATALRRLGRTGEEAAAWSIFLKAYPSSAHAENARKRLAEIGGP